MDENLKNLLNCKEAKLLECEYIIDGNAKYNEFSMISNNLCFGIMGDDGSQKVIFSENELNLVIRCDIRFEDVEIIIMDNEELFDRGILIGIYKKI